MGYEGCPFRSPQHPCSVSQSGEKSGRCATDKNMIWLKDLQQTVSKKPQTGILTNGRAWLTGVRGTQASEVTLNLQRGLSHGDVCTYQTTETRNRWQRGGNPLRVKVGAPVCVVFTKFCILGVRSSFTSLSHGATYVCDSFTCVKPYGYKTLWS